MAEDKAKAENQNAAEEKAASSAAEKKDAPAEKKKPARKTTARKTAAKSTKKTTEAAARAPEKKKTTARKKTTVKKSAQTGTSTSPEKKPAAPALSLSVDDGIGVLTFDMPGKAVNVLDENVINELDALLDELVTRDDLKALLITSAKEKNFIAGADITAFDRIKDQAEGEAISKHVHRIFGKLSYLPYPTIAVIHGTCLGGGTELALACTYRIARDMPATKIGLPEVKLGILPGWGGTQRLPRLIGIQKALDYILTGRLVSASKAYRDGLIDRIIPAEFPDDYARKTALDFAREVQKPAARKKIEARRRKSNMQALLLEKNPLGRRILFDQARKTVQKNTKGHYPAPMKAIEAVEKGMSTSLSEGLAVEAKFLGELIVSSVSKNLVRIFRMTEDLKKDYGVDGFSGEVQKFSRAGVLGAGIMGGGIAQLLAYNDIPVRMKDINLAAIGKGMEQASKVFATAVKKRKLKPADMQRKLGLISGTTDYSGFEKVDLVIEAIIEKMEVKKAVFKELDGIVPEHAVRASNTSSLSVTEMAEATKRPGKVAGLHFFNPVHKMPLVEVIRGEKTADDTVASLVAFSRKLGKTAIVVKDRPGFLVNRILSPYMNEALLLLEQGQKIEAIDKAVVEFGMPMGPLTLYDEVGIDVTHKVAGILHQAFGDKAVPSPILEKMVDAGRLGKKSGSGFYQYNRKERQPDAEVYRVIAEHISTGETLPAFEIQERCILVMINEAARCLEEEIVRHPRDVDIGMIFGTGFPPFRGGLLTYADNLGSSKVVELLEKYAEKYGDRFAPASLLQDMAKGDKKFFE